MIHIWSGAHWLASGRLIAHTSTWLVLTRLLNQVHYILYFLVLYFAARQPRYWHWLLRIWLDIWATGVVGGSGPQQHTARSNTQPGSLYRERARQCFSVIHPLQMMPVTFFVITKRAPARPPWRHQQVIDDQKKCVSEEVQNYSHLASVRPQTGSSCCSHAGIYDLAEHICNLWAWATISTLINEQNNH